MLVSEGAPVNEETAALLLLLPRFGASVIVLEPAAEVAVAVCDSEFEDFSDEAVADDAELVPDGESVLVWPMEPSALLRFWDAAADEAGCAELADDMSLPVSDGYTR